MARCLLSGAFLAAVIAFAAARDVQPTENLVRRVAGEKLASQFNLEWMPLAENGMEMMALGSRDGKVLLQGSSSVALASAFNWYLNDYLNTTYDWSNYEAIFPSNLPLPANQNLTRVVKLTYHLNVCTYGYTMAFVDWAYWEKHIDWMAMQGINMPLAFLGQEKVIESTFARFNITLQELQHFISGPAFLPWFRMGNMQAWGGTITRNWIDSRANLQHKVLARMRSLGMTPVLPAFAGFVPPAFATKFPKAHITRSARWNNFPDPYGSVYTLAPVEDMFQDIGRAWIEEQTKLYGTDHIYQCDTYNEMTPPSGESAYLASSSRAVYSAMKAGDSKAVWLMQGWLFLDAFWTPDRVQAYLGAVPDDSMMILDLASEDRPQWSRTENYFGKPWIWNLLLDYGGQQGFNGNLPLYQKYFAEARNQSAATLTGVGITMEGMWQNYMSYDFVLSQAWGRSLSKDTAAWARRFGERRYGSIGGVSAEAGDLWAKLYLAFYNKPGQPRTGQVACRPSMGQGSTLAREPSAPRIALWQSMLALAPKVASSKSYRFDLVDIGREAITAVFDESLTRFRAAFASKNATAVSEGGAELLAIVDDLDRLLSTDENFMVGRWIEMARSWGVTTDEQNWLEWNARNQITLWGPNGEIVDYATKGWGGLARTYFKQRWDVFIQTSLAAVNAGKQFDQIAFNSAVLKQVEQPWQHALDRFPSTPEADSVEVSKELLKKFAPGSAANNRIFM